MGRDTGAKCRQCRREGEKLFLKGERCYSRSCAFSQKTSPPGEGPRRRRPRRSQYHIHLREKQKARRIYGVRERQFRNYMAPAKQKKGITSSRQQGRQLITHGHFELNGRALNVPSTLAREGDVISVKESRRDRIKSIVEANADRDVPGWLERNAEAMKFQLIALPAVEQIGLNIAAHLIVEHYSR
jgi:small subunit ribosomal protein S4